MKVESFNMVKLVADEGKVFARKDDGTILDSILHLGINDSPDNYIEVDRPEEEPMEDV